MREITNAQPQQPWQPPGARVFKDLKWRTAPQQQAVSENLGVQARPKRLHFEIGGEASTAPSSTSVPQLEAKPQEWQFVPEGFAPPQARRRNFAVPREMLTKFEWKCSQADDPPFVNRQPGVPADTTSGGADGRCEQLVGQMLERLKTEGGKGFINFLLAHWESMPVMRSIDQRPVLVELVLAGQYDAVRNLLLCQNADQHLRAQCSQGANAMMHAALAGDLAMLQCLLAVAPRLAAEQLGHRIAIGNALMLAASKGHGEIMDLLLQVPQWAAVQLDCRSDNGENALMYAAANGQLGAVQKLLKAACILANETGDAAPIHRLTGAATRQGLRAIDLARDQGHQSIVNLLAPWSADSAPLAPAAASAQPPANQERKAL